MSVGAATSSSVLQRHLILCSVSYFVRMHPAVKFFHRFQSGLIADVMSSLVWTLAGDHQCASKLPGKCASLCEELVEAKEVQITHIIAWNDYERCLFAGLIVWALLLECFSGWCLHCVCWRSNNVAGRIPDGADRVRRRGVEA